MYLNFQKIINQMKKEKPTESFMKEVKFTKLKLSFQNLMGLEMRSFLAHTEFFQVDCQFQDHLVTLKQSFRNTEETLE